MQNAKDDAKTIIFTLSHELLNKLRNMYKKLGFSPRSVEANELLRITDVLDQIYSLFDEAVDAAKTYQTSQPNQTSQTTDSVKKQAKKQKHNRRHTCY